MKAQQLIDTLTELVKAHGDLELCYGVDDEGNAFQPVYYEAVEGTMLNNEFSEHTALPTQYLY